MNESPENTDGTQGSDRQVDSSRSAKSSGGWRAVIRVVVAAILGFLAVATVHQMLYEPTSSDGTYEWTLLWPGTPPGAKFKTESGDDTRRLLDILVADAGADWQGPLAQSGSIEVQLSHPAYPSLWTILKWRFGLLKGPQGLAAERTLLTMRINKLDKPPSRYEVLRLGPDSHEAKTGTFDSYSEAQRAVLDALAEAMDDFQT